jgi:hypothetical protein
LLRIDAGIAGRHFLAEEHGLRNTLQTAGEINNVQRRTALHGLSKTALSNLAVHDGGQVEACETRRRPAR